MLYFRIYLVLVNVIGFIVVGKDKRKAVKNQYRISHKRMLSIALLGGGIGVLSGFHLFYNKTRNIKLTFQVGAIMVVWIIGIRFFLSSIRPTLL